MSDASLPDPAPEAAPEAMMVLLQHPQSRWFWGVHGALCLLWLGQAALGWSEAGGLDGLNALRLAVVGALGMVLLVGFVDQRRHGPPRIELEADAIAVKTGGFGAPRRYPVASLQRMELTTARVGLVLADGRRVEVELGGYAAVRAAKPALRDFARRHGIELAD